MIPPEENNACQIAGAPRCPPGRHQRVDLRGRHYVCVRDRGIGLLYIMSIRHLDQRCQLHLLRAVDAIEAQRSLIRASAATGVSQPSLTKSLHRIEEILQARLFERHARGMRPNEAGAAVARTARRVLAELRRLDTELEELASTSTGVLSLGALPTAAMGVLPGVMSRLARSHPGIKIRLEQGLTEELLPPLAAGEIELVVGRLYELAVPDGFVREPLWSEPISVLARAGHPLLRSSGFDIEELRSYDLLLPSVTQRVAQETQRMLVLLNLNTETSLRSSSFGFIREMIHDTDSLAVMPRLMMVGDLLRGTLQVVPLPIAAPSRPAGLITSASRELGPAARTFVECLRAYVTEIESRLI